MLVAFAYSGRVCSLNGPTFGGTAATEKEVRSMRRCLCQLLSVGVACACLLPAAAAANVAVLDSAGARAVFDRGRNGVLTGFGYAAGAGDVKSVLHSMQPVFHYADPALGVYWAHVGGPDEEFGQARPERRFKAETTELALGVWHTVARDHYVRVEKRCRFLPGTPAMEMKWRFETLRDMQMSSWSTLASLRFHSETYERFLPSHRVEGGQLRPSVLKVADKPFWQIAMMQNWFAVRDRKSREGLLVLFPKLTGRAFIQRKASYLFLLSPYTFDKFSPKGEVYEFSAWLVPFRGDYEQALKRWAPRVKLDPSPALRPAVSPTGARLAETDEVLVWSELPTRKVLREEAAPQRKAPRIRISAARGEYEPFQLVIRGKEEMKYTRLERMEILFTDLKSGVGGKIPKQAVSSAATELVDLRYPYPNWSGPTPDTLRDTRTFPADPGKNTVLWVTVKVPRGTPPGIYDGSVLLWHGMGRGRKCLATVPLRVRVHAFTVPDKRHFTPWLYFSSRRGIDLLYKGKDTQAIWDRYVRNSVEHRACFHFAPFSWRHRKGSVEFRALHMNLFEKELKYRFGVAKAPHLTCRAFAIGAGHKLMWTPFGEPEDVLKPLWRARYRKLAKAMGDFLRERGWQDRVIFDLYDEPPGKDIPIIGQCIDMLKEEFPEIRVTYSAMWYDPRLYGRVNVWLTGGGYAHIAAQRRKAAGDTIWFGNSANASVDSLAADFRLVWWRYWLDGMSGCLHWHVSECNDWQRRPRWGRNRTATWLLRGEEGPINTIRWELAREGLEDYEYFWVLGSAVKNAKAAGGRGSKAAADGERVLARVKELVIRKGRFLSFNPDPKLLHEVREAIAAQIEKMAPYLPEEAR